MQDEANQFNPQLANLGEGEWLTKLSQIAEAHGDFTALGTEHFAAFVNGNDTLFVSFETVQGIRSLSEAQSPLGWELSRALGWSSLCLVSNGDTWFRDAEIYAFFDNLIDDGAFDAYERVVFYGAGPCGYAAAAFSVASPGATVVAIQPQATLDPTITNWDPRFVSKRRTDFSSRYGYAPDMLDAASEAFIIYDPSETFDAMHAALFSRPNVTKLRVRHLGGAIQTQFINMEILFRILAKASVGKLNPATFAQIWRVRRDHPPYLRNLLAAIDNQGHDYRSKVLCEYVVGRRPAPFFARRLKSLKSLAG